MFEPNDLIKLRASIQEEGGKYNFKNIAIAASSQEAIDFPSQFIADYKNGETPSPDDFSNFSLYLKNTFPNSNISFTLRSGLKKLIDYDKDGYKAYQFILDTSILLDDLTKEPFKEQFKKQEGKSKDSAEEREADNLDITQPSKKRKSTTTELNQREIAKNIYEPQGYASQLVEPSWKNIIKGKTKDKISPEKIAPAQKELENIFKTLDTEQIRYVQQQLNAYLLSSENMEKLHSVS